MTEGEIATTVTTMTFRTHPQHLRNLLTIQAQLLQTMQQILVQMQDVNQLIQSMEARPSSVKRKSNTQDDVGPTSKINATERQHPITKKVLRSLKQPQHVSIGDRLVILPIDAPIDISVLLLHLTPTPSTTLVLRLNQETHHRF
jgi:hypothetical protein